MKNALFALLRLPWRGIKWCFATRIRALVSTFAILCALLGGSYEAYSYSMSSGFCHQCHFMDPYCESWKRSSHRDVECVKCHFEPGFGNELHGKWVAVKQLASAVTGAYSSMPYAEVSDATCMRSGCHTKEELSNPVSFTDRGIGFKHDSHLTEMRRGIKLACTSCHFQKLVDTHMEVDKSTCFLCHFKDSHGNGLGDVIASTNGDHKLGSCDTCHGPPEKTLMVDRFKVDHVEFGKRGMTCLQCHVELSPKPSPVGEERCYSCHNEPDKLDKIRDTGLMHVAHVTKKKLHCYQCHTMIPHKLERAELDPSKPHQATNGCASCHMDSHGPQGQLYAGTGARGVASTPDPMQVLGMDCIACHRSATTTHGSTLQSAGTPTQSCKDCHDERYTEFVGVFNTAAAEMTQYLEKRLAGIEVKIEASLKAGKLLERDAYRQREDARHNLSFLKRAVAIHNPIYAFDVLRATRDAIDELGDAMDVEEPDEDPPLGFEREDCDACHDALPEPGDLILSGDRRYPHALHVEQSGLSCDACHQGERHPPIAPTTESSCKTCHKNDSYLKKK